MMMTKEQFESFKKENKKYLNSDLVKKLKMTDDEIIRYFSHIKFIIDENEACQQMPHNKCVNESYSHRSLIRTKDGELKIITVPCEKKKFSNLWVIKDFSCDSKARTLEGLRQIAYEHKNDKANNKDCTKLELIKKLIDIRNKILEKQIPRGIYVYGKYGVGKSFILYRFCEMLQEQGLTTAFVSVPDLVRSFKETFSDNTSQLRAEYLEKMIKVDVLVLDDLGAELPAKWFYNEFFEYLLRKRMGAEKLTFFTSNYKLEGLLKKYAKEAIMLDTDTGRIADRIKALTGNTQFQLVDKNNRY